MLIKNKKRIENYIIIVGILFGSISIFMLPETLFSDSLEESKCFHQVWFSRPCPGCGMTRAFYNTLHMNFSKALSFNPSIILFIFYLIVELLFRLRQTGFNSKFRLIIGVLLCISLFVTYIYRLFFFIN